MSSSFKYFALLKNINHTFHRGANGFNLNVTELPAVALLSLCSTLLLCSPQSQYIRADFESHY